MAWTGSAHSAAAFIAYHNLNPKARKSVDALLQSGASPEERNLALAANWADRHRGGGSGRWHYINLYFRTDGRAPLGKPDASNAVVAVRRFSAVVANSKTPTAERAKALRYVLHFVVDLHQPLHATALESNRHPRGDKGGNDYAILAPAGMPRSVDNLHRLWDLGCGAFPGRIDPLSPADRRVLSSLTASIEKQSPKAGLAKAIKVAEPMAWAKESLALAKKRAYAVAEGARPSARYMAAGQSASRGRIALSGYRLAALLNRTLGR